MKAKLILNTSIFNNDPVLKRMRDRCVEEQTCNSTRFLCIKSRLENRLAAIGIHFEKRDLHNKLTNYLGQYCKNL